MARAADDQRKRLTRHRHARGATQRTHGIRRDTPPELGAGDREQLSKTHHTDASEACESAVAQGAAAAAAGHGRPPPNRSSAAVARTAYTAGAGAGALERGPVERRRGAEDRDAVEPRGAAAEVRRHSVWRAPRQSGPFGCGVCCGGAIGAEAEEAWRRVSRRLRAARWVRAARWPREACAGCCCC